MQILEDTKKFSKTANRKQRSHDTKIGEKLLFIGKLQLVETGDFQTLIFRVLGD